MLISVHRRFMNLYVEQKAEVDKAGKVKSCFACNCEHDIKAGVPDCWFFETPVKH